MVIANSSTSGVPYNLAYIVIKDVDVICHNCMQPGHFSNKCQELQVGYKEKEINRAKVEKMMESKQKTEPPAAAPAAAVQPFEEHPKVQVLGRAEHVLKPKKAYIRKENVELGSGHEKSVRRKWVEKDRSPSAISSE